MDPRITLALLSERHNLPGKRDRVSVMFTYPSYLGELIEYGERLGIRRPTSACGASTWAERSLQRGCRNALASFLGNM